MSKLPPEYPGVIRKALMHEAYYNNDPYPYYGFQNWRTEERGPFPVCVPIVKSIIDKQANWLFGKPMNFDILEQKIIDLELKKMWEENKMNSKLQSLAIKGFLRGSIAIKYSVVEGKIKLQILSPTENCILYYHEHDFEKLTKVRIVYPFNRDGHWFLFREDWTDETYTLYKEKPLPTHFSSFVLTNIFTSYLMSEDLEIDVVVQEPNPFGVIPITVIKNSSHFDKYGVGDFDGLFKSLDRLNLSYWLMDTDNQKKIDPSLAFIDLEPKDSESQDRALSPGEVIDVKTLDDKTQGRIQLLESQNTVRDYLTNYANDLKNMIFDAVGAVFPRQADITNKGSMTQSVLIQMYKPLLETIDKKRLIYGECGIKQLLKNICIGMKNYGLKPFDRFKDDYFTINLIWFDQFPQTEDQMFSRYDRLQRATSEGYLSPHNTVKEINRSEGFLLTEEELNERVEKVKTSGTTRESRSGNDPGGTEDGQFSGDRTSKSSRQQKGGFRVKDAS